MHNFLDVSLIPEGFPWNNWLQILHVFFIDAYRLVPEDLEPGSIIPLRYVKFQNVQNLMVSAIWEYRNLSFVLIFIW